MFAWLSAGLQPRSPFLGCARVLGGLKSQPGQREYSLSPESWQQATNSSLAILRGTDSQAHAAEEMPLQGAEPSLPRIQDSLVPQKLYTHDAGTRYPCFSIVFSMLRIPQTILFTFEHDTK